MSTKKTKKKIVEIISTELKVSQVLTKKIVQRTFDLIVETLVENGRIELRKFGVFAVKTRKPRKARNPKTDEPVQVDAKNVVTFQAGKDMEEKVRFALKVVEPKKKKKPAGKGAKAAAAAAALAATAAAAAAATVAPQPPEPKEVAPEPPPVAEPQVALPGSDADPKGTT